MRLFHQRINYEKMKSQIHKIGTLANSIMIQLISRKNTQNLPIFGLKFRQIGDLLGTRIVRVFGQKYSRFE